MMTNTAGWVEPQTLWGARTHAERVVMCSLLDARDRLSALPEHAVAKDAIDSKSSPDGKPVKLSRDRVRVSLQTLVVLQFVEYEEAPHDVTRPLHYRYWLSSRGLVLMQAIYPEHFEQDSKGHPTAPADIVREYLAAFVADYPDMRPTDVFLPRALAEVWAAEMHAQPPLLASRVPRVLPFVDASRIEFRSEHGCVDLWAANVPVVRVFGEARVTEREALARFVEGRERSDGIREHEGTDEADG